MDSCTIRYVFYNLASKGKFIFMFQCVCMNEHVLKCGKLNLTTSFEIWAMGHAWVIPSSYHHQHYCAAFWGPCWQGPWVKNGFGLRSGLLSTTHQVRCFGDLCVLWHIFITWSRDSSEAVLLMYVGVMVLILSSWVMRLFQGWWGYNAWWQKMPSRWKMWRAPVVNQGATLVMEKWAWLGRAYLPLVYTEVFQERSLKYWKQKKMAHGSLGFW